MQEEVTQKTIALVIKTAKLDANVLKAAMRMYLNHRRQKAQKMHGKTSVKKLVGEGVGVSSIEVTDGNIKSFERVARKYNVDFAVKKDKTKVVIHEAEGGRTKDRTQQVDIYFNFIGNFVLPLSEDEVEAMQLLY